MLTPTLVLGVMLALSTVVRMRGSHAEDETRDLPGNHQAHDQRHDTGRSQVETDNLATRTTISCSSRGCHGAIVPMDGVGVRQTEYTIWLNLDHHSKAYATLLETEAEQIVNRLAGGMARKPAYEDERCLACHSEAKIQLERGKPQFIWNSLGVGCEACHGQPDQWLDRHYHQWSRQKAEVFGMNWLRDVEARGNICVGCHVGAPPSDTVPVRDVNHDLLAAGHPRLQFDLRQYLKAMPPHWVERNTDPLLPARTWAAGQWAMAKASLELLADRATAATPLAKGSTGDGQDEKTKRLKDPRRTGFTLTAPPRNLRHNRGAAPRRPWPELSEWRCFDCHHDIRANSWRRVVRGFGERTAGMPRWNHVSGFHLMEALTFARLPPEEHDKIHNLLRHLDSEMGKLRPDPGLISNQVADALRQLRNIKVDFTPDQRNDSRRLNETLQAVLETYRRFDKAGWEESTQLFLALDPLTAGLQETDEQLRSAIDQLLSNLEFPPEYQSPYMDHQEYQRLQNVLKRLRRRIDGQAQR